MARQKSYDRDEAVENAMLTFWEKGYSNVGVRQLEKETSINRFALQTEFGGKEGLFLEALNKYLEMSDETALKPLKDGGLGALKDFFEVLTTGYENDPRDAGCLMVNTVIENAELGIDSVRQITSTHYDNMQKMFVLALEIARERKEISLDFDIDAAARYLLTFAMGIEVYVRMHLDVNAARKQADFLINEINNWALT